MSSAKTDAELESPQLARDGFDVASFRDLIARLKRGELSEAAAPTSALQPLACASRIMSSRRPSEEAA